MKFSDCFKALKVYSNVQLRPANTNSDRFTNGKKDGENFGPLF